MSGFQFDRVRQICEAADGVDRLRQLVLDLAAQGRLVPGSTDSPQRRRLLTLPEAADYRIGKTPPSKEPRHWDSGGIPWVSISDMEHFGTLTETSRGLSRACVAETFKHPPVPAGSLLMSFKLTVGKVCILGVDGYHNEAIISIQPKVGVSRDYLMRVLPSIAKQGKSKDALMGATLNSSTLAQLVVPLPELDEQLAIVAKVDELMALCDRLEARQQDAEAAHARLVQALLDSLTQARDADEFQACWQRLAEQFESLFTTDESVDRLQRSCIQWALAGRFATHLPTDEPASVFVSRAAIAREEAIGLRGRKRTAVDSSVASIDRAEPGMPDNWCRCRIDEITECLDYLRRPVNKAEREGRSGSIPYYGANGQVGWIDEHLFDEELVLVVEDETFIGRTKPFSYVIEGKSWVNNHAHVLRPLAGMSAQYLNLCLHRYDFIPLTSGTTGRRKLTQAGLNAAEITIAPLAEQARIVEKVDELISLCDQLKARIAAARAKHAQLAQALVEQALA